MPSGCGAARGIRLHAVQEPARLLALALGADEGEPHAAQRSARAALGREDDLVVAPLLELVAAVVPDRDRAAAVLAAAGSSLRTSRTPSGGPRSGPRGCCAGTSAGTPRGTAQLTSTPSRSSRKSQCRRDAWCSWMTKIGSSSGADVRRRQGWTARAPACATRSAWRCTCASGPVVGCAGRRRGSRAAPADRRSSSTRSSTSSKSSWRSPGSSSSSHVRGTATVGCGRPRSEYGAIVVFDAVVLAPVDEHPPVPDRLLHAAHDEVGVVRLDRAGEFVRDRRRALAASARAAARCTAGCPCCRSSRGRARAPCRRRISRAHRATSAHSASPTPGPGVEVQHEPVGIPSLARRA